MGTVLSLFLLIILLGGAWLTASRMGWIQSSPKYKGTQRSLNDQLRFPRNALEHGKTDMLVAVYDLLYKNNPKQIMHLTANMDRTPIKHAAEMICEAGHEWRLERYRNMDLKKGRTSRQYMASPNSDDFAQYILGGRQILDLLDKQIQMIQDEKRLEQARAQALEDSDKHYTTTRKELNKLQNPELKAKDEHAEFDNQMKEIENGKK